MEGKIRSKIFPEFYKKFQRKRKEIFFNRNSFFNDILIINKGKIYNFDSISNTLLNNYKFRYTGGVDDFSVNPSHFF